MEKEATVSVNDQPIDREGSRSRAPYSVLIVTDIDRDQELYDSINDEADIEVTICESSSAQMKLATSGPDVALFCSECRESDVLANSRRLRPETPMMVIGDSDDVDKVVDFIRNGACDFIQKPCSPSSLVDRIRAAITCGQRDRDRVLRLERLKGICRRLSRSKQEISSRLDELQQDIEDRRTESDRQIDEVACVSEFRALIGQELGVEEVLRTGLEFILAKSEPTNVGAFLANSNTDFSLGAYVNYDCPRELANPVLDKFASSVCEHVAAEDQLIRFEDVDQFIDTVGEDAEVLRGTEIVAMPCSHEGECMAVLFLFRQASQPFTDELAGTLDALREILGQQLATVVRVHHRMESIWPPDPVEDVDDSSDWGFGEAA